MTKRFTLGKKEKLKSRKSIEQLFNEGKKINLSPYRVLYIIDSPAETASLLFGTGVSAKNFKKAVDRNRVKRMIREAYRLQKKPLQEKIEAKNMQVNVFFLYTGKELPRYEEVYKQVGTLLNKLDKLVGK